MSEDREEIVDPEDTETDDDHPNLKIFMLVFIMIMMIIFLIDFVLLYFDSQGILINLKEDEL